jgi:hypothetical protein
MPIGIVTTQCDPALRRRALVVRVTRAAKRRPPKPAHALFDNSARRVENSSRPLPCSQFALRRGPTPNIAHSFFATLGIPSARLGVRMISNVLVEPHVVARFELGIFRYSFCTFIGGARREYLDSGV